MSTTRFKRTITGLLVLGLAAGGLTGCSNNAQTGAGMGALGGGLAGALLGSGKNQEQWALIGAATGGVMGYMAGNEMDKNSQQQVNNSLSSRSNQPTAWRDSSGNENRMTPESVRYIDGRRCREASMETRRDGEWRRIWVLACERPDGSWEMKEIPPPHRGGRPAY